VTASDNLSTDQRAQGQPGTISSGLLGEVKANAADGWTRMTRLYAPLVFYWCLRQGLQPADAEDVVQEVFRTIAARVGEFQRKEGSGSFRAWLRTITRHKIGDLLRAKRRRVERLRDPTEEQFWHDTPRGQPVVDDPDVPLPEETAILYARVLEIVESEFEPSTWRAFYRVVIDGVSPKAVAEELGLSVNSVYLAKSRVLRRVRDELGDAL
jgi:RNA polymerase sigma-70 factor (ECF subfamily)